MDYNSTRVLLAFSFRGFHCEHDWSNTRWNRLHLAVGTSQLLPGFGVCNESTRLLLDCLGIGTGDVE